MDVEIPSFTGKLQAWAMSNPMCTLIIGNNKDAHGANDCKRSDDLMKSIYEGNLVVEKLLSRPSYGTGGP